MRRSAGRQVEAIVEARGPGARGPGGVDGLGLVVVHAVPWAAGGAALHEVEAAAVGLRTAHGLGGRVRGVYMCVLCGLHSKYRLLEEQTGGESCLFFRGSRDCFDMANIKGMGIGGV